VDIEYQQLISHSHSVTRCLSLYPSLPRMLQMHPASHSYFMSIDKPTVVLKHFFGISLSEPCSRHYDICNHFWLLLRIKFRIWGSPKHHLLRLYRVSSLWRQGFKRNNQMCIPSQVKSALRKLRDWEKATIVTVCYLCQMYAGV